MTDETTVTGHIFNRLLGQEEPEQGWSIWAEYVRARVGVPLEEASSHTLYKKGFLGDLDSLVNAGYLRREKGPLAKGQRPTRANSLYSVSDAGVEWWEASGREENTAAPLEGSQPVTKPAFWLGKPIHKTGRNPPPAVRKALDKHVESGRLGIMYYDPRRGRPVLRYEE
jgi:hypothetical protein